MPKLKSKRGAMKRFKKTASGNYKHKQSFTSHILTKKSPKRKRQLRHAQVVSGSDKAAVARMCPGL